jgi:hypothetical protein
MTPLSHACISPLPRVGEGKCHPSSRRQWERGIATPHPGSGRGEVPPLIQAAVGEGKCHPSPRQWERGWGEGVQVSVKLPQAALKLLPTGGSLESGSRARKRSRLRIK